MRVLQVPSQSASLFVTATAAKTSLSVILFCYDLRRQLMLLFVQFGMKTYSKHVLYLLYQELSFILSYSSRYI